MGGIGKTSLAKYVFQLHSGKFHKSSFVEGVNTRCNECFNGLLDLQKQLHGDISKKYPLRVSDVSMYTSMIENALAHKMVFLVLDDVDSLDQLDALLGNKGFHQGSKIIITTKDASLTGRCALFNPHVQFIHRMVKLYGLSDYASRKLFYIHAFKSHTPEKDYTEVSEELVKYCKGHPLALQVLGKSLHKRDVTYWREILKGLKKEPHSVIKKVLQMSIDALSSNDMELFKHISCFFVGKDKYVTETILDACDINTQSGVTNLIDRCLLSIIGNKLTMHQLIQDMGRYLVLQESPNKPWECSRLWCHEESFKVLDQKKCVELVHIDLSYCCKLKKLPSSMGKLKKVTTLLLDGCNPRESHIQTMPSDLMLAAVSLPCSLTSLSLANANLSNESFPMDWSCLSMLKKLCLDENPIVSMPNCVRTLPRLRKLSMSFCELCTTIDHPPPQETVRYGGEHHDEEQVKRECGIGLVYDEDGKMEEEEEDVLGYYKLWNHIIGGDLSPLQLTTGEYVLKQRKYIKRWGLPPAVSPSKAGWRNNALIDAGSSYAAADGATLTNV
ncbi:hypothetical protein M8C21_009448 [Ambrosia artemisiifolia]|uniref:NB-ARC domain-containing protein n=1 Tax=Ambrosia artemisiifolia TaxID=4212 RepID=A0AAD5G7E4_AMBAR|nr:hypothetical protein M8C21_009448 [Ambrosia artemisiifolia]